MFILMKNITDTNILKLQCGLLKVKLLIFFIDSINLTPRRNNWCLFPPETGPFEGMLLKLVDG